MHYKGKLPLDLCWHYDNSIWWSVFENKHYSINRICLKYNVVLKKLIWIYKSSKMLVSPAATIDNWVWPLLINMYDVCDKIQWSKLEHSCWENYSIFNFLLYSDNEVTCLSPYDNEACQFFKVCRIFAFGATTLNINEWLCNVNIYYFVFAFKTLFLKEKMQHIAKQLCTAIFCHVWCFRLDVSCGKIHKS